MNKIWIVRHIESEIGNPGIIGVFSTHMEAEQCRIKFCEISRTDTDLVQINYFELGSLVALNRIDKEAAKDKPEYKMRICMHDDMISMRDAMKEAQNYEPQ